MVLIQAVRHSRAFLVLWRTPTKGGEIEVSGSLKIWKTIVTLKGNVSGWPAGLRDVKSQLKLRFSKLTISPPIRAACGLISLSGHTATYAFNMIMHSEYCWRDIIVRQGCLQIIILMVLLTLLGVDAYPWWRMSTAVYSRIDGIPQCCGDRCSSTHSIA